MIFLVFKVGGDLEDAMIIKVFLMMNSWEEKSMVFPGDEIFFNELADWKMKLSNEDSMLCSEDWNTRCFDSFAESELESFSFFLWRSSLNTLEDEDNVNFNGVKTDEEEDRWLDPFGCMIDVGWRD